VIPLGSLSPVQLSYPPSSWGVGLKPIYLGACQKVGPSTSGSEQITEFEPLLLANPERVANIRCRGSVM